MYYYLKWCTDAEFFFFLCIKFKKHINQRDLKGNSFILPQCRNSIAILKLGRWIVVQQRRRGREKRFTQSTIAHMARIGLIVNFVKEMAFVSTTKRNTLVLSVRKERDKRISQSTIAHMEIIVFFVYFVMVGCARPHTVLR